MHPRYGHDRAAAHRQPQPQPASPTATLSRAPLAAPSSPVPSAIIANASSRPSASTTRPASVVVPLRLPVLARTTPAPALSGPAYRLASVPDQAATGMPVYTGHRFACRPLD